jgi:hypothetical protein
MKTKTVLLGGVLTLVSALPCPAPIISVFLGFTDPALFEESEIIVVGRTGTPQFMGEQSYATEIAGEVEVERFLTPVSVERVLKGADVPGELAVVHFRSIPPRQGSAVYVSFEYVPANDICLLCLVRDRDEDYRLTWPNRMMNVVRVGRVMPHPQIAPANPLEAVVAQLLFSVSAGDLPMQTRRQCLMALGGFGSCLCPYFASMQGIPTGGGEQISQDEMLGLVQQRIWPRVLDLTQSDDGQLAAQAWRTLARLQYPDAVPQLVAALREDQTASWRASLLGKYRCSSPRLVALLNPLLGDEDARIREAVAYALRHVADRSSLPYLIEALDDTQEDVRYFVVCALSVVTGENVFPAKDYFQDKEAEFIRFWKDWAANHPDQVKKE